MEQNNKKVGYLGFLLVALVSFFVGYLSHPQFNNKKEIASNSHQMSNGTVMNDDKMVIDNPMSPQQMMNSMSSKLEGKTGNDFDATFLEQMVPHHQGAVTMAQMVLKTSKRPELIKMANDIISSQNKEITQMKAWQREWFGVNPL